MGDQKLSCDEVPHKFAEWLLTMGCPPDKVPSVDKVAEMCRGQYYMVWRSLMEHVEPKDSIRNKRLQVFCNDMQKSRNRFGFTQKNTNVVTPEQLTLWRQRNELQEKVTSAELRITQAQRNLQQVIDKTFNKLSQRNIAIRRLQDIQRRAWLLQQVAEDLKANKSKLEETKVITDSLASCNLSEDNNDIESKLDGCMSVMRQPKPSAACVSLLSAANPVACSSLASTTGDQDAEEHLTRLVQCRGDVLWPRLVERRARLTAALADTHTHTHTDTHKATPQSVLSHTAALHLSLALEAMKYRALMQKTQTRLSEAVAKLNLSGESCEMIVVECERVRASARVEALRALEGELRARAGAFACARAGDTHTTLKQIHAVDKAILSKKDELKRLVESLVSTERKIQNVRRCLLLLFNSFHGDGANSSVAEKYPGHVSLPQESIKSLREFYEEYKAKRKTKMELSMDFEVSDSFTDSTAEDPKFTDELRIYLKKFNLEKNRKLVLESSEKIWIFESIGSQLTDLLSRWQVDDVTCPLLCPSVTISYNLQQLVLDVQSKELLEAVIKQQQQQRKYGDVVDISSQTAEGFSIIDKVKKRLNENLHGLHKTAKTLDLGLENLGFWSENNMKKYISHNRTVNGMTYKECENYYCENLKLYI